MPTPEFASVLIGALAVAACSTTPTIQSSSTVAAGGPPVEVAVTFDDLPIHGPLPPGGDRVALVDRLLAALQRHQLPPVYGFVNGKRVADEPGSEMVLRHWLAAGHLLGNHTYAHVSLNAVSLPEYFADIEKGEDILTKLQPPPALPTWKMFRYPFLFEGDTLEKRAGVRQYLRDRGYTLAEVTIEADDWAFNEPFVRCANRGDGAAVAALRRTFVDVHVNELNQMRTLTQRLGYRDVRQVLLLHVGAADADVIDDLLTAYERAGVRWIDLPTALRDPFYALDPAMPFRFGSALPYLLARARGVPATTPSFGEGLEKQLSQMCR